MKPILIIAFSLFTVSLSAQAATLTSEDCAAIENPDERLACYDTIAGRLPVDTGEASGTASGTVNPVPPKSDAIVPAAPPVAPTAPAVAPTQDEEAIFGSEHKQKPEKERPHKLQVKWTKKKKDAFGKWIIILENGQVWHQTDNTHFSFKDPEHWVVISHGLFGSFFMGEPERKAGIRVKRVK